MHFRRTLAAALAALMTLPLLAACADEKPSGAETPDTSTPVSQAEETTTDGGRAAAKDNLPPDLTLNGRTVTLFSYASCAVDTGTEEETGDNLNDAVYYRNLAVEERLDVDIRPLFSEATKWQDFASELRRTISAGDTSWDVVFAMGNSTIQSGNDDLFLDVSGNKYIDFDQPWWWKTAIEEVSFDGSTVRYMVGDLALSNFLRTMATFFNKKLYEDVYGDPDALYRMVIDGKWTLDELQRLSAGAYNDLNGSGEEDEGDTFGYASADAIALEYATDVQHYYRDERGYPVVEYDVDRAQTAVEKLIRLFYETKGNIYGSVGEGYFTDGRLMFNTRMLLHATSGSFREMKDDYGIVPTPKLDDTQKNYNTMIHNSSDYVAIPKGNPNPDEVGAVIEALCSESYRSVIELFFETVMKTKYSRDALSGQCIDIIRDVTRKQFLYEYNSVVGSGLLITECVQNRNTNFASLYASKSSVSNRVIQKKINAIEKEKAAEK